MLLLVQGRYNSMSSYFQVDLSLAKLLYQLLDFHLKAMTAFIHSISLGYYHDLGVREEFKRAA